MIARLWTVVSRAVIGGSAQEGPAAQPLLAGYKRAVPAWVRFTLLFLLAAAGVAYGWGFGYMAPVRMMPYLIPIAVAGVLIIWALPAGDYAPTRALEPLLLAFFASLVMWPNYLAIALPSLPWVTLLRLVAVPTAVVLLVCLSSSRVFRTRMKEILSADPWAWKILAGLVAVQTYTLAFSNDPGLSINRYIIGQFNLTTIFFVSAYVFSKRGFAELWVRLFMAMMIVLCIMGIWESRLQVVPWAGHIPSFLRVEEEGVQRVLHGAARSATGIYRVQGTHTTSLGLAEVLGLSVPFAVHFALDRYPAWLRAVGAVYVPLAIYVILLTDSRLGVVAAIASVLFYLLIWALLRWRSEKSSLFGPAIVLGYPAIFVAAVASTFVVGRLRAEVWGNGPQQASTESRMDQWRMAIPRIEHNPLGYGYGRAANALHFVNQAGVITIDSYYLSVLLDWGIAGFLLFYGLVLRHIWKGGRAVVELEVEREVRLLMPFCVSLINFFIVKSVLSQDDNHPLAFMMMGAVLALTWRAQEAAKAREASAQRAVPAGAVARAA